MRAVFLATLLASQAAAAEISLSAQDTVSGFEMDVGDVLKFKLRSGQVRSMELVRTEARVLLTNLKQLKKAQPDGGTLYEMTAHVRLDGHPLRLRRYLSAQDTFAEPWVLNGMRLWLDAVSDVFEFLVDAHGGQAGCRLNKRARFAANDARDPVAPIQLHPWFPVREPFFDIGNSYNGDDAHMGAYQGAECHAGLDINHPQGTPLFTPVPIDDHFLFNSLAKGDNNNRWRGFKTWPNGDRWTLQAHHIAELLIAERRPIPQGVHYASAAGVLPGNNEHSHFVFRTQRPGGPEVLLDPWILFWQIFLQERDRAGEIRATMEPLGPARVGQAVRFSSAGSRIGRWGRRLDYYWTFGDGGFSRAAHPVHVYARPGAYAVTLTVADGADRASTTQVMTVDGAPAAQPALALRAPDEWSFLRRKPEARDIYGIPPKFTPHTVRVVARLGENLVRAREVALENVGAGVLGQAAAQVRYDGNDGKEGWLEFAREGAGNAQKLLLRASAKGLPPGFYRAWVNVGCPGALNSPQELEVLLDVRQLRPPAEVVVDNADASFHATPYFWLGHKFRFWKEKGYNIGYLTNGARPEAGEVARFAPRLRAGRYEVAFVEETPFALDPQARFAVRVKHKHGDERLWMEPARKRVIGQFDFEEGEEGFVEVLAEGSRGQVLVDAVRFRPLP